MSKITPEIDQLMWAVAEDGDPKAALDFSRRFPEYAAELDKRRAMVRSLKGAKPHGMTVESRPLFAPAKTVKTVSNPAALRLAYGFGLAALGLAVFLITSSLSRGPAPIEPAPTAVAVVSPSPVAPNPVPEATPTPTNTPAPRPQTPPAPYLVPQDFVLQDVSLIVALQMIGAQSGLTVEIAPGFPDVSVRKVFQQQTAVEVLRALGAEYGFTAFEQEPGKVLVVPARDPNNQDPIGEPGEAPLTAPPTGP